MSFILSQKYNSVIVKRLSWPWLNYKTCQGHNKHDDLSVHNLLIVKAMLE